MYDLTSLGGESKQGIEAGTTTSRGCSDWPVSLPLPILAHRCSKERIWLISLTTPRCYCPYHEARRQWEGIIYKSPHQHYCLAILLLLLASFRLKLAFIFFCSICFARTHQTLLPLSPRNANSIDISIAKDLHKLLHDLLGYSCISSLLHTSSLPLTYPISKQSHRRSHHGSQEEQISLMHDRASIRAGHGI